MNHNSHCKMKFHPVWTRNNRAKLFLVECEATWQAKLHLFLQRISNHYKMSILFQLVVEPPIWKICSSSWIISPNSAENKKYSKTHHLDGFFTYKNGVSSYKFQPFSFAPKKSPCASPHQKGRQNASGVLTRNKKSPKGSRNEAGRPQQPGRS